MEKTIYHGSDHIIEKPKFSYGKPYNDYGIGFYCTQNLGDFVLSEAVTPCQFIVLRALTYSCETSLLGILKISLYSLYSNPSGSTRTG